DELDFLTHINPEHNRRYAKLGLKLPKHHVVEKQCATDEELVREVASLIADGKIVGWCQGAFEHGPRALGARSMLIRPDNLPLAQNLSREVKSRAAYRPYALSMTQTAAEALLVDAPLSAKPFRWMQITWPVHPRYRSQVASGLHIDGTTRPQVVTAEDHPLYAALLEAVGKETGL